MQYLSYNTTDPSTTDQFVLANATLIVGPIQTGQDTVAGGFAISDEPGTLYIDQSIDGENWDVTASVDVGGTSGLVNTSSYNTAGGGTQFEDIAIVAPYLRVRYVNGNTSNNVLRFTVATVWA